MKRRKYMNNPIKYKNIELNIKKAFTLTEVVIATFISSIVLAFIFLFLTNIVEGIANNKNEINILGSFYDLTYKLNNYRNVYITGGILIETSTGSDIFLMEDLKGENGILFGPVTLSDNLLNNNNTIYENKGLGFRKVSSVELAEIKLDNQVIYDYFFQEDNIFYDLKVQDLIISSYNSGSIFDLTLVLDLNFNYGLVGQSWSNLPRDSLKRFNIDF